MKTRDEIIAENPIEDYCAEIGIDLKGSGNERTAVCPFHEDGSPSFSVNVDKQAWICRAGCGGGSIIDLMAKKEGLHPNVIMKRLGEKPEGYKNPKPVVPKVPGTIKPPVESKVKPVLVKTYDYFDAKGELVYQACRMEPKSFRQRRPAGVNPVTGKALWYWDMNGVERVLYNLLKIQKTKRPVVICEGEKDCDSVFKLGWVGTCNVGGAGKWCDAYAEALVGKEVILCGDNDAPGKAHMDKVMKSLEGKAKLVRLVKIPEPNKDVTEWLERMNGGPMPVWDLEKSAAAFQELIDAAPCFDKGINLPLQTAAELEYEFEALLKVSKQRSYNFKPWLPKLGEAVQPIVPGELVTILAASKVGKTAIASNMIMHAAPMHVLFFQQELPASLTFQRSAAMATGMKSVDVWQRYISGNKSDVDWRGSGKLDHIVYCHKTRMTPDAIEKLIVQCELKIGAPVDMFVVDYLQLCGGKGERGDRIADAAEGMKVVAKNTNTIAVMLSQRGRANAENKQDDRYIEPRLTDGKFAGEIENSSGLILGAWQNKDDKNLLNIRVLGNTKGYPGTLVECEFDGECMLITQRKIADKDVPVNVPITSD